MPESCALERVYLKVNVRKLALPANQGRWIYVLFYLKMRFFRPQGGPHRLSEIWSSALPFVLVKYRGHRRMLKLESELILDPPRPWSLAGLFHIALVLLGSDDLHLRWIGNLPTGL